MYSRGWKLPVIAIVNQKGGTGKTTLSINLASAFAESFRTLLLDADPQGSALDWAENRTEVQMNLDAREIQAGGLIQDVRALARDYDWVIIDGPPGISRTSAEAVRAADMVLIPCKPSPFDVWAAADIVAAVQARQKATGGVPRAYFVVTMARPRTRLYTQVNSALAEYGMSALSARTTERVSYPTTAIEGRSVIDSQDRTAQREILAIRDEILEKSE